MVSFTEGFHGGSEAGDIICRAVVDRFSHKTDIYLKNQTALNHRVAMGIA